MDRQEIETNTDIQGWEEIKVNRQGIAGDTVNRRRIGCDKLFYLILSNR